MGDIFLLRELESIESCFGSFHGDLVSKWVIRKPTLTMTVESWKIGTKTLSDIIWQKNTQFMNLIYHDKFNSYKFSFSMWSWPFTCVSASFYCCPICNLLETAEDLRRTSDQLATTSSLLRVGSFIY